MSTTYTAIVRKRTTFRRPVLNSAAKPRLVDALGREIPKDDKGEYIGPGIPMFETTKTEAVVDPLTDEAGNVVRRNSIVALLVAVREEFTGDEETEVLHVTVLETKPIRELTSEELWR